MSIGSNVGVDTSSSAFLSAANKQNPLAFDQWASDADSSSGMFHSTTILESAVYITCFFLTFRFLEGRYFGTDEFMRKWKITPPTAMDIACKCVSGGFAIISTLGGILMLWRSPDYDPEVKDRSSFLVDRVMVWAMSYFVYDFFAMYHVYLARKETTNDNSKAATINQENLSQTTKLEKTVDEENFSNELKNSTSNHNSTNGDNSILSSVNKNIQNSDCDNNRKSISDEISGVSSNGTSHNNASLRTYIEDNPLIVAHHLIIGVMLIPMMSVHYPRHEPGDMMIAAALIFEASTPFVSLRSVLSQLDGMRHSRLYMFNGIAMVIAFFSCRILIYPIFYKCYGLQRNINMFQAILRTPWRCSIWMVGLLLPQLYWFRIMLIGALKVIREPKKEN